MLGTASLLVGSQRALKERPRAREVALGLKQAGEAVYPGCCVGMLGAEDLFVDRQCALIKRSYAR